MQLPQVFLMKHACVRNAVFVERYQGNCGIACPTISYAAADASAVTYKALR